MAKFTIDDFASGKASSGPKENSELKSYGRLSKGEIIFPKSKDDEKIAGPLRVIKRGSTWFEFIVYNHVTMPPNCGPGTDNPNVRYGASFVNQQLAQRAFERLKTNVTQTIEI